MYIFPNEGRRQPVPVEPSPTELLDTQGVELPPDAEHLRALRNKNIRRFWNDLAHADLERTAGKKVKYITNPYVDYLGNKLNCLFYKFSGLDAQIAQRKQDYPPYSLRSPSARSLLTIFRLKKMSELLAMYYTFINPDNPQLEYTGGDPEEIQHDIWALFQLLERDFQQHHPVAHYQTELIQEYLGEETTPAR